MAGRKASGGSSGGKVNEGEQRSGGEKMSEWMRSLAEHFEETKRRHPEDRLMILFDIDGTILDMRALMLHALQSYDGHHDSRFFQNLALDDINVHETEVREILKAMAVPDTHSEAIVQWYREKFWSSLTTIEAHLPFNGVMEVIRWFQSQPATFIGLNTGRPEEIRRETLHALNRISRNFNVFFPDELLYMNPGGWGAEVTASKVAGVRHFQKAGYRIFAFVDNEPDNLEAVAGLDPEGDILLLHADTIFKSKRERIPRGAVSGSHYDIRPFPDFPAFQVPAERINLQAG